MIAHRPSIAALWRPGLAALLLLAAALRLWRLDQNGFGNEYYSAGVRSMSLGWHSFLYHAFDPAGFLSVDKPPLALWVQVASVTLLGFHGLAVLLPQALEGVAAVWLLARHVRRPFGVPAGLLAGLLLALTPVSVAVDRSSNTESALVLVLLLAAGAALRAAETGSRRWWLVAMALVGVAFNVKMLAAHVVLPALVLVHAAGAPVSRWRRLADLALGAIVLVAVSLAWVAVYDLTPPERRPWAGTTDGNLMRELVVGPYAVGRFVRQPRAAQTATAPAGVRPDEGARGDLGGDGARAAAPRTGRARQFVGAPAGPLRLADGQLAGQVAWLWPVALAGLALGAPWRRPFGPPQLALLLWAGWALTYAVVYSAAGGFFHFYYLSTMAPPLAALAAVGTVALWRGTAEGGWRAGPGPLVLAAGAGWQLHVDASAVPAPPAWLTALRAAMLGGALGAAAGLLVLGRRRPGEDRWRRVDAGTLWAGGIGALLILPGAWALSSVLVAGPGTLPAADVARLAGAAGTAEGRGRAGTIPGVSRLLAFLRSNHRGERFLVATSTTALAAPIIIQTGQPVMARGGFHGLDPILTPDRLATLVAEGQVRFVMVGDLTPVSRWLGAEAAQSPVDEWIRAHGVPVDPGLWAAGPGRGAMRLYDLRPDRGPVSAPAGG